MYWKDCNLIIICCFRSVRESYLRARVTLASGLKLTLVYTQMSQVGRVTLPPCKQGISCVWPRPHVSSYFWKLRFFPPFWKKSCSHVAYSNRFHTTTQKRWDDGDTIAYCTGNALCDDWYHLIRKPLLRRAFFKGCVFSDRFYQIRIWSVGQTGGKKSPFLTIIYTCGRVLILEINRCNSCLNRICFYLFIYIFLYWFYLIFAFALGITWTGFWMKTKVQHLVVPPVHTTSHQKHDQEMERVLFLLRAKAISQ